VYKRQQGKWFAEGHGVDPDIRVAQDPAQLAKGVDQQLEAGIQEVVRALGQRPVATPKRPPYENRTAGAATAAAAGARAGGGAPPKP